MSGEYCLPSFVKEQANHEAVEIGIFPDSVHHIVPRYIAKRYRLDERKIKSPANAIALEQPFHDWIHQTYEEEDYIFLAQVLLGISEEKFEKKKKMIRKTNLSKPHGRHYKNIRSKNNH